MYEYFFIQEGRETIVRIKAPTLADAMIRLANAWSVEPRTFTTAEAKDYLELLGVSLRSIEDIL